MYDNGIFRQMGKMSLPKSFLNNRPKHQTKVLQNIAKAFVGGMAMGLTSAPLEAWYLAWFALIPLWLIVINTPSISRPAAQQKYSIWRRLKYFGDRQQNIILCALAWGLGYQGLTLFWITGIHPLTWMGIPWLPSLAIATLCWLIITGWGMGIPLLWTLGMLLFQSLNPSKQSTLIARLQRVLFGVALWCVVEFIWSRSDLFWHFLAFSQSPHNLFLLQLTQLSGFTTVTTILVAVNGFLAEGLQVLFYSKQDLKKDPQQTRKIALLWGLSLSIFCAAHIWGGFSFQSTEIISDRRANIGIIQGNIPNEVKLYENGTSRAIANYTKGYRDLAAQNVELIVTPETAIPFQIEQILARTPFIKTVREQKIPILLGAFGPEDGNFTNSLFTLNGFGRILSRYNKQQLVPLGEYIPFEAILGKFIDRLSPLDAHLVRGQNPPVLLTPIGKAIAAICYESAYPEHFRRQTKAGGEYIIVSSNDAHYSPTMPAQHQALDVMQAIANHRWTIRASNTGLSSVINPRGEIVWQSELNQYVAISQAIFLNTKQNLYVRWGNWLILLYILLIIGQILYFLFIPNPKKS